MKIKLIKNWKLKKIIWTKYFIVTDYFAFLLILYWKKYYIRVPENFITDFWSIPAIFFLFDKTKYVSYILHDFLYSPIWLITSINWPYMYDRSFSDDILLNSLRSEWMRNIWSLIVRIWVEIWWESHYKKRSSEISDLKLRLNIK